MQRRSRQRPAHDPWRPLSVVHERERTAGGPVEASTIFLVGAECRFSCVFCDLWKHTLEEATPVGAIPRQIDLALAEIPHRGVLKLYNASNFFDERAIPAVDDVEIARRIADFSRVVVECHPRLLGDRCRDFVRRIEGRLEVAMGLETVHPEVLATLDKGMSLEDFDAAAERLRSWNADLRVFVLLGLPSIPLDEQVEWCRASVVHAAKLGAATVSIVPVRPLPQSSAEPVVDLALAETAFDEALEAAGEHSPETIVQIDTWDLDRLPGCGRCAADRRRRLAAANLDGKRFPGPACDACGGARGIER